MRSDSPSSNGTELPATAPWTWLLAPALIVALAALALFFEDFWAQGACLLGVAVASGLSSGC